MFKNILKIILISSVVSVNAIGAITDTELNTAKKLIQNNEYQTAKTQLIELSKQGNIEAMFYLGQLSLDNTSELYDFDFGFWYVMAAAKKGYIPAYKSVIENYLNNEHDTFNLSKASLWSKGYLAKGGDGAESLHAFVLHSQSDSSAEEVLRLAKIGLEKKQPLALKVFGLLYQSGQGVKKSSSIALQYFKRAQSEGVNVHQEINNANIDLYSPKFMNTSVYGINRDVFTKLMSSMGAQKATSDYPSVDLYRVDNKSNLINVIAIFNKFEQLALIRNVFEINNKMELKTSPIYLEINSRYTSVEELIVNESLYWKSDLVNVALKKINPCKVGCDGNETSLLTLEYQFIDFLSSITPIKRGSDDAQNFSY
jgi:hypothetical protein